MENSKIKYQNQNKISFKIITFVPTHIATQGIALSILFTKVFEYVILNMHSSCLILNNLQFSLNHLHLLHIAHGILMGYFILQ